MRKITSTRESYTSLNISDNQLDQIKPKQLNDIFSHLPNLSVLHTSFNQLDQMEQ
ncbi:MAG: hypothetical protein LBG52_06520 [Candidatus Peribacteria bacterium]|nr:hypothetical protein [Candidatus Peribacteria bacterium]